MTVHVEKLIEAIAIISKDKNIMAAASGSLKGGLVTGLAAFTGGLLLGPVGLMIGGAVGGFSTAMSYSGKFQPLWVALKNLPEAQKKLLYKKIVLAFKDLGIEDVQIVAMILSSNSLGEVAIKEAINFLKSDMGFSIKS